MHIKLQNKETSLDFKQFVYITLPQSIYEEMMYYTKEFTTECSGCGLVEEIVHKYEDTTQIEYLVKEIFLPEKQDNHGAGTEYDGEEVAKILTDCIQAGKIDDKTHLRFHWHSHVNMSVYHSSTDEDNYDEIQCGDFLVSIVANKSGDILGSLHYYKPMRFDVDSIPVYVETGEELDKSRADLNIEKVKEHNRTKTVHNTWQGHGGYIDDYDIAYDRMYNRGNAEDKDFDRFVACLMLVDGSGEFEYLADNVVKDLTSNKLFEVFLDEMTPYEAQEFELELQAKESDNNVSTK